jgi:hypothetical protein
MARQLQEVMAGAGSFSAPSGQSQSGPSTSSHHHHDQEQQYNDEYAAELSSLAEEMALEDQFEEMQQLGSLDDYMGNEYGDETDPDDDVDMVDADDDHDYVDDIPQQYYESNTTGLSPMGELPLLHPSFHLSKPKVLILLARPRPDRGY